MRRGRLRTLTLDVGIGLLWLVSVGLVVLHERGGLLGGTNPIASLGASLDAKEAWFGIYYQGQKIGHSSVQLIPEERNGIPGVGIIDQGLLVFNLFGQPQKLQMWSRAFIDANWQLQAFSAAVLGTTYSLKWEGARRGDELIVTVTTPSSTVSKQLHDPSGSAFVNALSSWTTFHRLKVGQSGRAWLLNPLALTPDIAYFTVRRTERLEDQEALVVETDIRGMTVTTWVTPEGDVLKELSPLGWELRREPKDQALQKFTQPEQLLDLLAATSVIVDRPLESPQDLDRLVLLIDGVEAGAFTLRRPWQELLPAERLAAYGRPIPAGRWCLIELRRPALEESGGAVPQRYSQPSAFVQSEDPRIKAKAAEIVGARTDPWERALAITHWVFSTMVKRLTVGLPSAVDILAAPAGDCHEHTVLYTALARSAGLPTRMVAGLVYQQGRFFYHAWPEVWVGGQWIPTDPTLGQDIADITHIGLVEAENEGLVALGQFIGQVRIEVLETHAVGASRSTE